MMTQEEQALVFLNKGCSILEKMMFDQGYSFNGGIIYQNEKGEFDIYCLHSDDLEEIKLQYLHNDDQELIEF